MAGNALTNTSPTGANETAILVDNLAPTVTIKDVPSTSSAPFTGTFDFSEAVTGFVVGDITLGNAGATSFMSASSSLYTALITPTADGTVTVDVAANAAVDLAGNGNTVATRASSTYTATVVNTPAMGAPTITGTPTVGETLTAVTTAIMDDDGLTTPGYTYQWIRVATDNTEMDIGSATASTYTLVSDDLGTTIKVKVSFTDDASNAETLTSVATAVVAGGARHHPAHGGQRHCHSRRNPHRARVLREPGGVEPAHWPPPSRSPPTAAPLGLPIPAGLTLTLAHSFLRSRLSSARARPSSSPTPTPPAATTPTPSRMPPATTSPPSPPA